MKQKSKQSRIGFSSNRCKPETPSKLTTGVFYSISLNSDDETMYIWPALLAWEQEYEKQLVKATLCASLVVTLALSWIAAVFWLLKN